MSKQSDLVVLTPPPSQPIANKAHKILQEAIVALSELELEAKVLHCVEDHALNQEAEAAGFDGVDYDEWREKRNVRIIHNTRMENLWRDLHNIVRKIKSGIGAVEYYR